MSNPSVAIRVISLVGSVRRVRITNQLDELGLEWSFFDALRGPPPDIPYDPTRARRRHGRALSHGELGCFSSHRALWHLAAGDTAPGVLLVLEDDVLVDPHFFSEIETVAIAAARYPYLRLYAKFPESISCEGVFLDRYVARFNGRAYGTQAYFITKAGARRFLQSISQVVRPIDDEMDRFWAHGIPTRAVFPFPVLEVDRGSVLRPERSAAPEISMSDKITAGANKVVERARRHFSSGLHRLTPV